MSENYSRRNHSSKAAEFSNFFYLIRNPRRHDLSQAALHVFLKFVAMAFQGHITSIGIAVISVTNNAVILRLQLAPAIVVFDKGKQGLGLHFPRHHAVNHGQLIETHGHVVGVGVHHALVLFIF